MSNKLLTKIAERKNIKRLEIIIRKISAERLE